MNASGVGSGSASIARQKLTIWQFKRSTLTLGVYFVYQCQGQYMRKRFTHSECAWSVFFNLSAQLSIKYRPKLNCDTNYSQTSCERVAFNYDLTVWIHILVKSIAFHLFYKSLVRLSKDSFDVILKISILLILNKEVQVTSRIIQQVTGNLRTHGI